MLGKQRTPHLVVFFATASAFLSAACAANFEAASPARPPIAGGAVEHKMIDVNDVTLHVAEIGDGPLVILLHGFPELWYSWRRQLPALAEAGFKAVAPDMRGFGESSIPSSVDAYDAVDQCGDITGLMDYYGVEQAVVVGHDWGSAAAFYCAQFQPERFRALVTVSVPYGPQGETPPLTSLRANFGENFFYMIYFQSDAAQAELEGRTRELFEKLFVSPGSPREPRTVTSPLASAGGWLDRIGAPKSPPDWIAPEEVDYFVQSFERTGFLGGLNYYRNLDRSWELLREAGPKQMPRPALFISGTREFSIAGRTPENLHAAMSAVTPDMEVRMIPDGGHWIMDEKTQAFNAILIDFLNDLK